jgi:serine/threonine protein kinase/Flp pilus assembly protein TadD
VAETVLDKLVGGVIAGAYRLEQHITTTGMSVVYRASDAQGNLYAVKILAQIGLLARFIREAQLGKMMTHPHIVRTLDAHIDPPEMLSAPGVASPVAVRYIVMPWIPGISLRDLARRRYQDALPTPRALIEANNVLLPIADALYALHIQHRYVHRDVKPSNILFVERDQAPYLVDLGIARELEDPDATNIMPLMENLTRVGEIVGTNRYMPPEQFVNSAVTPAADQYALAITIYEMLSNGKSPYEEAMREFNIDPRTPRTNTNENEQWHRIHLRFAPTPLTDHRRDLPVEVWSVLKRALEKKPHERYPSIWDFAQDFAAVTSGGGVTLPTNLPPRANTPSDEYVSYNVGGSGAPSSIGGRASTNIPSQGGGASQSRVGSQGGGASQAGGAIPPSNADAPAPLAASREGRDMLLIIGTLVVALAVVLVIIVLRAINTTDDLLDLITPPSIGVNVTFTPAPPTNEMPAVVIVASETPTATPIPTLTFTLTATEPPAPTATHTLTADELQALQNTLLAQTAAPTETAAALETLIAAQVTALAQTSAAGNAAGAIPTLTNTATALPTLTNTATALPTLTNTATALPTLTNTATALPTLTNTATALPTLMNTATALPTLTNTATALPTTETPPTTKPTVTPFVTDAPIAAESTTTVSPTFTFTPSPTETPRPTFTFTPTDTLTFTPSPTPTETLTPTLTPTETPSPTLTFTPSPTLTFTPTETPSPTPTETPDPVTLAALGARRAAEGDHGAAVSAYDRALAITPDDAALLTARGSSYLQLCRAAAVSTLTNANCDAASADFARALELQPDNLVALVGRGQVAAALGQYDAAISDFDAAISADRAYVAGYVAYAEVLLARGGASDSESAIRYLTAALRLDTTNAEAYRLMGEARFARGEWSLAREAYQRYVDLSGVEPSEGLQARLDELDRLLAGR